MIKLRGMFSDHVYHMRNMSKCVWKYTQPDPNDCLVWFWAFPCLMEYGVGHRTSQAIQITSTAPLISAGSTQQELANAGFWGNTVEYSWIRAQQGFSTISLHIKCHRFNGLVEKSKIHNQSQIGQMLSPSLCCASQSANGLKAVSATARLHSWILWTPHLWP